MCENSANSNAAASTWQDVVKFRKYAGIEDYTTYSDSDAIIPVRPKDPFPLEPPGVVEFLDLVSKSSVPWTEHNLNELAAHVARQPWAALFADRIPASFPIANPLSSHDENTKNRVAIQREMLLNRISEIRYSQQVREIESLFQCILKSFENEEMQSVTNLIAECEFPEPIHWIGNRDDTSLLHQDTLAFISHWANSFASNVQVTYVRVYVYDHSKESWLAMFGSSLILALAAQKFIATKLDKTTVSGVFENSTRRYIIKFIMAANSNVPGHHETWAKLTVFAPNPSKNGALDTRVLCLDPTYFDIDQEVQKYIGGSREAICVKTAQELLYYILSRLSSTTLSSMVCHFLDCCASKNLLVNGFCCTMCRNRGLKF